VDYEDARNWRARCATGAAEWLLMVTLPVAAAAQVLPTEPLTMREAAWCSAVSW